jgi:hypothetical protein
MNKQNSRRSRGRPTLMAQRQGEMTRSIIPHPPPIQDFAIVHSTRLRFITNTAVNTTTITFKNLLDTLLMCTSAVTAYDLFQLVKIRRVQMWAVPVIGNATTVVCEFVGAAVGQVGDGAIHTDTSMGIDPAHVSCKPSARSQLSQFQCLKAYL